MPKKRLLGDLAIVVFLEITQRGLESIRRVKAVSVVVLITNLASDNFILSLLEYFDVTPSVGLALRRMA